MYLHLDETASPRETCWRIIEVHQKYKRMPKISPDGIHWFRQESTTDFAKIRHQYSQLSLRILPA